MQALKQWVMWGAFALFYAVGVVVILMIANGAPILHIIAGVIALPVAWGGAWMAREMHLDDRLPSIPKSLSSFPNPNDTSEWD